MNLKGGRLTDFLIELEVFENTVSYILTLSSPTFALGKAFGSLHALLLELLLHSTARATLLAGGLVTSHASTRRLITSRASSGRLVAAHAPSRGFVRTSVSTVATSIGIIARTTTAAAAVASRGRLIVAASIACIQISTNTICRYDVQ
jgi:hypothetical protein